MNQFGFYAGDTWRLSPKLTLTYGARFDIPTFPDKPTRNPVSEELFGYRTDEVPSGLQFSPRIGFNFNPGTDDAAADPRRRRPLLGPHAVRLAEQPVPATPASTSGV